MRIGIGIGAGAGQDGTIDELLQQFERAETDGFASAWVANIFSHDAITLLALAGRVTSRLELGTFVVPTYPRHPVALAQHALTAAAAADGRFTLGIGLSHRVVIEDMLGLDYSKPIRHAREYLSVLIPLLEGQHVRFRGELYRVNAQVSVPGGSRPPVVVAALGPQMLRLAGRMADGTATWMGGPSYLANTAVPTITAAAAEAGRPAPRVVAGFPIAVTKEVDAARAAASKTFQVYGTLPSYRAVLDVEGAADPADIAIVGSEAEVEAQVRGLASAGVTDLNVSLFSVQDDPEATSRTRAFMAELARAGV